MSGIKNDGRRVGLWYLGVIIFGISAEIIRSNLVIPGDGMKSMQILVQNEALFRLGFIFDILMMLCFVLVGLRSYFLLKHFEFDTSMLLLIFVVLGVAINMVNLQNYYEVFYWAQNANPTNLLLSELEYRSTYNIANVFFGLWLLPFGSLLMKSKAVPTAVGLLVFIGGIAYLCDTTIKFVAPSVAPITTPITAIPSVIGEFAVTLWLLIKGTASRDK